MVEDWATEHRKEGLAGVKHHRNDHFLPHKCLGQQESSAFNPHTISPLEASFYLRSDLPDSKP